MPRALRLPRSRRTPPDPPAARSAKPYFQSPSPRLLAHRGLALEAPENTLLAFLKALAIGVTYLETDVRATRDGVAVLCHDPDLVRVAGRKVRVNQLTMAELREVDLGEGQTFVSLDEALDAFPEAKFNLDVKAGDAVEPAVRAVLAARAVPRVLATSFDEKRRSGLIRGLPGVATSASVSRFLPAWAAARAGNLRGVRHYLRGVDAVQIPERAFGIPITTRRTVGMLHEAGVEVHVWTINDPSLMRHLLSIGVDGLVTDRSDLALKLIADR